MIRKILHRPQAVIGLANEYAVFNSDKIASYTFNSIPNHVDVAAIKLK